MKALAASAGVNQLAVAQAFLGLGSHKVFAGAGTRVGLASGDECVKGLLVKPGALRLPDHRGVRRKATHAQLLENKVVHSRHAAGGVHIFQSNEPLAAMGSGV
jgi:hypothetical protein